MIKVRDYSSILGRSLGFIKRHQARLSAGLIIALSIVTATPTCSAAKEGIDEITSD